MAPLEIVLAISLIISLIVTTPTLSSPEPAVLQKWSETNLTPNLLQDLVNEKNCKISERNFLACAEALEEMSQAFGVSFSPKGSLEAFPSSSRQNERLLDWKRAWNNKQSPPWDTMQSVFLSRLKKEEIQVALAEGINGYLSIIEDPHTYIEALPRSKSTSLVFEEEEESLDLDILPTISPPLKEEEDLIVGEVSVLINKRLDTPSLITITEFKEDTCVKVFKALNKIKKHGVTQIAIDLKNNPGGLVSEAVCVSSLFLGKKLITTLLPFQGEHMPYYGFREADYTGSITVIIGSGSASASEILSGALKVYERATIIGEVSYGKGTFQDVVPSIYDQYGVRKRKTSGYYILPDGSCPQLKGITPQKMVKDDNPQDREDNFLYPIPARDVSASK